MSLRRDLRERIQERLYLWYKDSMALYEMADLKHSEAVRDIVGCQISALITTFEALDVDRERAKEIIDQWMRFREQKKPRVPARGEAGK